MALADLILRVRETRKGNGSEQLELLVAEVPKIDLMVWQAKEKLIRRCYGIRQDDLIVQIKWK